MYGLNPFGDGEMALSADGITIPKGHPDRIEDASIACKTMAHVFDDYAGAVLSAGNIAENADWSGRDSILFCLKTQQLRDQMRNAGKSVRRASSELRTFAHVLENAQRRARRARREGKDAQQRAERALGRLKAARTEAQSAETEHTQAGTALATAKATADVAGAQDAGRRQTAARSRATNAQGEARSQLGALVDANADVRRAIKQAQDAHDDARQAALAARGVLEDCADQVPEPLQIGAAPVPVTPTSSRVDLSGTGTVGRPFKGLTPGDVRRSQQNAEAEERQRQIDAQPSDLERFGSILANELGGVLNSLTVGGAGKVFEKTPGVKNVWDPDSPGAKYGEGVAGLIPTNAVKNAAKKIGKKIIGGGSKKPHIPPAPKRTPHAKPEERPDGSVVFRDSNGKVVTVRFPPKRTVPTTASKGPQTEGAKKNPKPGKSKSEKVMEAAEEVRKTVQEVEAAIGMPRNPPDAPPYMTGIG